MSLVHSGVVLQALSIFTGATVKPLSDDTQGGVNLGHLNFYPDPSYTDATDATPQKSKELTVDINNFLDPGYDYDFTDLTDDSTCMRGNEPYKRPCGWKRIAIKVLDKYPDGNVWLGSAGWRSYSVDGEWPVSYHGTSLDNVKSIIKSHYTPGSRQVYGRGIYSTYDINEATGYSHEVKCEVTRKTYKVLMQNRINPKMRKVCDYDKYWLIEIPKDTSDQQIAEIVEKSIRPYGILFKEV